MSKILYHYDPETGLLKAQSVAKIDPKASKDEIVYVVPPYSTFQTPPEVHQVYRVARFDINTNSWSIVDDFRGLTAINKQTKESVVWNKIGPLPKEYTFKKIEKDLYRYVTWNGTDWFVDENGRQRLIDDIWELRKNLREQECVSDIEYSGHMIHVDPVSFNDIMLAAQEALLSGDMTTTKRWVTADNVDVQLNGNDFIAIARLYGARRQRLVYESNEAWQHDTEKSTEALIETYRALINK